VLLDNLIEIFIYKIYCLQHANKNRLTIW